MSESVNHLSSIQAGTFETLQEESGELQHQLQKDTSE